jgi:hypothetical protein
MQNFVLHPLAESEGSDKQAADSDLLAVRFPHVSTLGVESKRDDQVLKVVRSSCATTVFSSTPCKLFEFKDDRTLHECQ